MAKNALQAQLLKAGLVDAKKAKKINQQQQHAVKTGHHDDEVKNALAQAQAEKLARDQALNRERQIALEQKTQAANIRQMLSQHQIQGTAGEVTYQFIDAGKIKKLYVTQEIYNQIVLGRIAIARLDEQYPLLPRVLADKIAERAPEVIIIRNEKSAATQTIDEEDPYAAYVIPDDLMW
ncbi:MAG: DUF2058 domain-containing protein [Aquirhabdus sp.]